MSGRGKLRVFGFGWVIVVAVLVALVENGGAIAPSPFAAGMLAVAVGWSLLVGMFGDASSAEPLDRTRGIGTDAQPVSETDGALLRCSLALGQGSTRGMAAPTSPVLPGKRRRPCAALSIASSTTPKRQRKSST